MTKLHELARLGQSIWYDNIRRALLDSGELAALVEAGVTGLTSNPTIFDKAIAGSTDYDAELERLVELGEAEKEIFEVLALEDIGRAADLLRPVYDRTSGGDGYVSLEVSPTLAHDTEGTIAEARRLFAALGRPNVMIKVPATPAGIPAIRALIAEGINVNITLIFSLVHYDAVIEAYIAGLEQRAQSGGDVGKVASVASFFISRIDTAVDKALEEIGEADLQGKIGIASARLAYARFREVVGSARWERLAAKGARVQRPLWASTGTKNPRYPDTLYVDNLIGPDTVNTVPPATLEAFLDHGEVGLTLESGLDDSRADLARLAALGIDLEAVTQKLQDDGVAAFAKSFDSLIESIAEKRAGLLAGWEPPSFTLGDHQKAVDEALAEMAENQILSRIWEHDHTVWKPSPTEITNRLGWLTIPDVMLENLQHVEALAESVRADGYTHVLLLGMGGSSLAPEVFRRTFGVGEDCLDLAVLDSTDPAAILAHAERLDPARTLFIVSTKSGGTVETLSFFKFFYNWVADALGQEEAGAHFVAITDPGSHLADLAARYHFRAVFLNDPNIGGRYSALSYFGLVPAALVGVDVALLLVRAVAAVRGCEPCEEAGDNLALQLGAIMGELAMAGRDKLTFVASPPISSFGDWVEQLIAESTGKEGRGILPVVDEPVGPPDVYGDDRLFVYLRFEGDDTHDAAIQALEDAGYPVVRVHLRDLYDLGGQFFIWELATAVAGHRLGINPFDQPNVESAKVLARKMVTEYAEEGILPSQTPALAGGGITVYGDVAASSPGEALQAFLEQAGPGGYLALQAYVQPTGDTDRSLMALRTLLRDRTRMATTLGYGPRFLHSTGQLHKGDAGRGLFIQFTADDAHDAAIPDEAGAAQSSITFGVLKAAQGLGDGQALMDAGRKVIRFHMGADVAGSLKRLIDALS
jgi:transaldolase/glucose-6-phosphate isomerase